MGSRGSKRSLETFSNLSDEGKKKEFDANIKEIRLKRKIKEDRIRKVGEVGRIGESTIKGTSQRLKRKLSKTYVNPTRATSKGTRPNRQKQSEAVMKRKKTFGF